MRILAPNFYQSMSTAETFLFRSTNRWYEIHVHCRICATKWQHGILETTIGLLFNGKILVIIPRHSLVPRCVLCAIESLSIYSYFIYSLLLFLSFLDSIAFHSWRFFYGSIVKCPKQVGTYSHYSHVHIVEFDRHLYVFCDGFETYFNHPSTVPHIPPSSVRVCAWNVNFWIVFALVPLFRKKLTSKVILL